MDGLRTKNNTERRCSSETTKKSCPKKPFFENLLEKLKCKPNRASQTAIKKGKSNVNFERRIAKLELLIKKLQCEIYELSKNATDSLLDLTRSSKDNLPYHVEKKGSSAYSCSPCQIKTIIVKDINFTHDDIMKITNRIPELQNLFDFEASSSSSDSRNIPITSDETDRDYENNSIMEEEIDKLIDELKSEICNKLDTAKDEGRTLNNSKEEI